MTWGNFIADIVPASLLLYHFNRTFILTVCLQGLTDVGDNPSWAPDITHSFIAPTRAHTQNIPVHILTYTAWSCEVRSQPASAVLRFTLCSHVRAPPFHLVTAYLPVSLSVPLISHLSPQLSIFPSHLLSFHILPHRLLLSVSFSVYWLSAAGVVLLWNLEFLVWLLT